jgi:hypothetical protein
MNQGYSWKSNILMNEKYETNEINDAAISVAWMKFNILYCQLKRRCLCGGERGESLRFTIMERSEGLHSLTYLFRWRCVIAQAVSRRLPNAAARVRDKLRSCEICGEYSDTGAGFLRVLRFPLPLLIPPTAPHSLSIIRGCYNRPISGRRTKWILSL